MRDDARIVSHNARVKNLVALCGLCLVAGCQHHLPRECLVDPAIFCEPFEALVSEMPRKDRKALLALSPKDLGQLHFGLGMYARNRFGLWQDNQLTRFFGDRDITDAESMSAPFIEGFALYLQGRPVVMKEVIARHQPPPILEPEPAQ